MSEVSFREIIGLAKKSKWNQIKKFIKFILKNTLEKDAGYALTALDVSLNGKKELKYDQVIKNTGEIKEIDKIKDFSHLSLYQAAPSANNHINISQNNGTIMVIAKYLGPHLNDHQIFDFSVNLDALDEPFFTIGNGRKFDCLEILNIINKKTEPVSVKKKKEPKKKIIELKDVKIEDIEAFVFEKLTNKKAIWSGAKTNTFLKWKVTTTNKYRTDTGNITHYKGKPTRNYSLYLKFLLKSTDIKKEKPKKIIDKKSKPLRSKKVENEISEQSVFKALTGKNAVWNGAKTNAFLKWKATTTNKYRLETGNITHYKGKPTNKYTLYLKYLLKSTDIKKEKPKKIIDKKPKPIVPKKVVGTEISEQTVFKALTGKNAVWNGAKTNAFLKWKATTTNKYRTDTGNITHYKGKPTNKYTLYLKSLLNSTDIKKEKPKKKIDKKPKPLDPKKDEKEKELSEQYAFETITGKNAIWNGLETQIFLKWKGRIHKKYKKDTGKNPYFKQNLTKNYGIYLKVQMKFPGMASY